MRYDCTALCKTNPLQMYQDFSAAPRSPVFYARRTCPRKETTEPQLSVEQ